MCNTCLCDENMSKMIQIRDVPDQVHGILGGDLGPLASQPRNGSCEERIVLIPFVRSEFQLLRSFTLRVRLLRSRQTTKNDGLPHGSLRQLPDLGSSEQHHPCPMALTQLFIAGVKDGAGGFG